MWNEKEGNIYHSQQFSLTYDFTNLKNTESSRATHLLVAKFTKI